MSVARNKVGIPEKIVNLDGKRSEKNEKKRKKSNSVYVLVLGFIRRSSKQFDDPYVK